MVRLVSRESVRKNICAFSIDLVIWIYDYSSTNSLHLCYRYNPNVANEFSDTIDVIKQNLDNQTLVVKDNYQFYKILEHSTGLKVVESTPEVLETEQLAVLDAEQPLGNYTLSRIITSPKKDNSDIIYLYTVKEGE
jgi:hypothetical protein